MLQWHLFIYHHSFVEECPSNRVISLSSSMMSDSASFPGTDDEEEDGSQSNDRRTAIEDETSYHEHATDGDDINCAVNRLHTHNSHVAAALFSRQDWSTHRSEQITKRDKMEATMVSVMMMSVD